MLIVVTQSAATARWAAKPIQFGLPGWSSLTVRPLVLGPDNVPAKEIWEELMTATKYFFDHPFAVKEREEGRAEGREEGRVEGRVEGRAEERAEAILNILSWRGIDVPPAVRARVTACTDLEQLKVWSERAVHAAGADDLFAGDGA